MYKGSFLCALQLIDAKNTGQVNLVDVLDELSNETSGTDENSTLLIGDINVAVNTLAEIVDVVTVNTTNLENVTDVSTLNQSKTLLSLSSETSPNMSDNCNGMLMIKFCLEADKKVIPCFT
jgi:hypothetical protein